MPRETRLYKALQRRGLQVEYVPGWSTRGSTAFAPFGAIAHWTAGPAYGDRPSLNVVVNGRAGLPGPLAQVFLARSGVAVVVAAGRANHAGRGFYEGADGNTDLFGCECEWDGSPGGLTDAQKWAYPRVMATFMDLGAKWIAGHDEYATPRGRKVDVGSYINMLRSQTYALTSKQSAAPTPVPSPDQEDDIMIHYVFDAKTTSGSTAVYWWNPRDNTHRWLAPSDVDLGHSLIGPVRTLVEASGDSLRLWGHRPGAGKDAGNTIGATHLLGTYYGPASMRPEGTPEAQSVTI
jgi:hypothetical protein